MLAGLFAMMAGFTTSGVQGQAVSPVNGQAAFQRVCAGCHQPAGPLNPPAAGLMSRALPAERLKFFSPDAIYNAITNGKMQTQAASLSEPERRAVAEFASGQSFSASKAAVARSFCKASHPEVSLMRARSWISWGNGVENTRFQDEEVGKLTAANLPRLKLKWAYGFRDVASSRAQPIVVGEWLFVGSENRDVSALDVKSGCTRWTFQALAGVRSSLSVGSYMDSDGESRAAVFFGDQRANAYALDAQTGRQIWTTRVDGHAAAGVTGAPTVYDGRMFVPVQGIGEEGQGGRGGYECCTFRGSVVALDVNTGKLLWKTYTVDEPRQREKTNEGIQSYGPAGGSIWSSPTIDVKRQLLYVATGNGYADPPQKMTNAVIALDLKSGAVKWFRQVLVADIWAMGCGAKNPENPVCPAVMGPDYDFSAAPALVRSKAARDIIVVPQKSGTAYALDPDAQGKLIWQYQFGRGSGLGGQWGTASDGEVAYFGAADLMTSTPGGMSAVALADGTEIWRKPPPKKLCGETPGCSAGQGGPLTAIPGAVINGSMDGGLRAYSKANGSILWLFDTNREFKTVNGIPARGGSIDGAGAVVANGMLFVNSGYGGLVGNPGNVLLVFALDQ
jgi:polyvinyl alcohol dehydrogenase (cytochrome)